MRQLALAAVLAVVPVLSPPVDGAIVRPFDVRAGEYGPGHRGVDLAAPPGTPVRAAADGKVAFAGEVAGARHVVVAHPGAVRTTYGFLAETRVAKGAEIRRGTVIGTAGGGVAGHAPGVVHFGVRRSGRYVDPAPLLGRARPRIRLAPLSRRGAGRAQRCPPPHPENARTLRLH